jgi:ABC-type phosphate transport system substrate-binding protein
MPATRPLLAFALLALLVVPAAAASDYIVIVHPGNPASALSRNEATRLFMRTATQWPGGQHVKPVDLAKSSPVRLAFTKEVLGKSMGALEQYWTQAVFSGRAIPPPEKRSDAEVVAYVRDTPGAIGYVSSEASIDGVKRVVLGD